MRPFRFSTLRRLYASKLIVGLSLLPEIKQTPGLRVDGDVLRRDGRLPLWKKLSPAIDRVVTFDNPLEIVIRHTQGSGAHAQVDGFIANWGSLIYVKLLRHGHLRYLTLRFCIDRIALADLAPWRRNVVLRCQRGCLHDVSLLRGLHEIRFQGLAFHDTAFLENIKRCVVQPRTPRWERLIQEF